MLLLRSINGYDKSGDYILGGHVDELFDVVKDGIAIKQINGKQLKDHLRRCKKAGKLPKYQNVRQYYIVEDLDTKRKLQEERKRLDALYRSYFFVSVDQDNKAYYGGSQHVINCLSSVIDGRYNFGFEFDTGFVIGVYSYRAYIWSNDYSNVEFRLFGAKESFGFSTKFSLAIRIEKYTLDSICGTVFVQRPVPEDTQGHKYGEINVDTLGSFELTRTGTLYKGRNVGMICDKARFAKELIRRD